MKCGFQSVEYGTIKSKGHRKILLLLRFSRTSITGAMALFYADGAGFSILKRSRMAAVYETAAQGKIGVWYGQGKDGWYQYYPDNAGSVHFAGIVPDHKVPVALRRGN